MRIPAALALTALLVAGCTPSGGGSDAAPVTRPEDPCADLTAADVPPECFPEAQASVPVPSVSSDLPPVVLPAQPIDLVRGGNDADATLRTRTFSITVPAGARLAATSTCRGSGDVAVVTRPASKAEHTLPCNLQQANEITVLDPKLLTAPVTYQVTVTAAGPSRWYVALGAETLPPPPE